jgi:diaminopimelate epimerase
MMKFHKYHGLGNDYIVIDPRQSDVRLDRDAISPEIAMECGQGDVKVSSY